jgi:pentatricopeptide repeat protein
MITLPFFSLLLILILSLYLFQDMRERSLGVTSGTLTALVFAAARARRPDKAEELILEMEGLGVTPDQHTW